MLEIARGNQCRVMVFCSTHLPLVACTPILLVFTILIPYLCFRNLEKHSVVERLRME